MSKAGKSDSSEVGKANHVAILNLGSQHPSPERIPHSIPQNLKRNDITNSPVKESGLSGNPDDDSNVANDLQNSSS